jgi:hypothetical protein
MSCLVVALMVYVMVMVMVMVMMMVMVIVIVMVMVMVTVASQSGGNSLMSLVSASENVHVRIIARQMQSFPQVHALTSLLSGHKIDPRCCRC